MDRLRKENNDSEDVSFPLRQRIYGQTMTMAISDWIEGSRGLGIGACKGKILNIPGWQKTWMDEWHQTQPETASHSRVIILTFSIYRWVQGSIPLWPVTVWKVRVMDLIKWIKKYQIWSKDKTLLGMKKDLRLVLSPLHSVFSQPHRQTPHRNQTQSANLHASNKKHDAVANANKGSDSSWFMSESLQPPCCYLMILSHFVVKPVHSYGHVLFNFI